MKLCRFKHSSSYLTLVSGMPMAAGCEGNLLPEAAGCGPSLCQRLPDVSVVVRLGLIRLCGALTTPQQSSSAATVSRGAPLPSQNFYLRFWESSACPAVRCRMWTRLLPEAGGCNLMFLPEAAGGGPKFLPETRVMYAPVQSSDALNICLAYIHSPMPS